MTRPRKCHHISFLPDARYFKPQGIPMHDLEKASLSFEEIEAIRLKGLEGLMQTHNYYLLNKGNNEY
jgi:predicted DNA-binding protein (UPF0251 family)